MDDDNDLDIERLPERNKPICGEMKKYEARKLAAKNRSKFS